ncbi:response regulator transcription factor [Streptomyces fuscichromogenes]|uniref:DNA-binding response regulator n=1 Tax=Streptomyces fuscichromogenes TaxID=1324013 RepID=A0A918CXM4_9ACTN|nr:response regulator transcription factor [Streptomyces fuscichromogenes]GGN45125.1 DNA-binding response regulator [Streptomyces fuscichromogenes]
MPPTPIRVVIADEQSLLRESLCALLDTEPGVEIVGQTGHADELLPLVARTRPDLVVLDVRMAPAGSRESLVSRLLHGVPACHVLVLSMLDQPRLVQSLLDLGIHGYLHKSIGYGALIDAVRAQRETRSHQTVTLPLHRGALHAVGTGASCASELSAREVEILTHAAAALSNRQIAVRLGIAEGTVKRHLSNIFAKLDAVSRLDAVNKAASMRFIHPADTRGAHRLRVAN